MQTPAPFAIVGIGCRFPGGADSPAAFWRLLERGVDAIGEIPEDRFDLQSLFDPDPAAPGRLYIRRGGYIDGVDRFDAGFFGMSPREARHIDPQHRLLLELAWEALEDAGLRADQLAGSRTGVFVGISTHDYGDIQTYPGNRHLVDSHTNVGTATSLAANRISYAFDLRGPSLIVDTACSSSLTAVHLACRSLAAGECDAAVVGGVQMLLTPEPTIGFCKASMLSPDGRCRAFDARANGYVRSEGGGVVVLRPLDAALRDRQSVYAVVRGTAINQDGHTTGMTVPSARAQEAMLRQALAAAGLSAADLQYIEAHGTGTPVGDPIEASAIGAVLADALPPGAACAVGSVKTNIGHLEAASGMAGLIKTALALRHRAIPPSLHFESPNPAIDFDALRLRVVTALESWPDAPGAATAGVNSFGFGGANAHVLLQEHRPTGGRAGANRDEADAAELLVISAKSPASLAALARDYAGVVAGPEPLAAICASAALRRTPHAHRLAVVGNRAGILDGLDAFLAGEHRAAVVHGQVAAGGAPPLAFVFSGMGPQWWGMGRQLLRDEPVFRETIERCHAAMPREAGWSLMDELLADEARSRVSDADLAQVTGFALQAALAELLRTRGVVPGAVVGHSAGEMAAAFVSGALSLEACVPLAYHRSRLQAGAPPGRMLAAAVSEAAARRIVEESPRLFLAAVNSPDSVTISGDADAVEALFERLQQDQLFVRLMPFPVAYHSDKMDGIEAELVASLAALAPGESRIPLVSTVTADWLPGPALDASYWWRNVRQPVLFAGAMARLAADGFRTFLEIGPHPALAVSMTECLAAAGEAGRVLPTLRRHEDERAAVLRALGALHVLGHAPDWRALFGDDWTPVPLPSYRWDRQRHWFDHAGTAAPARLARAAEGAHPLLGSRLATAHATWETSTDQHRLRYLDDHVVQGEAVFPGVGYLEMAAASVREGRPEGPVALRDLAFVSPLFIGGDRPARVQLAWNREEAFEILSQREDGDSWTLHARGHAAPAGGQRPAPVDLDAIRARCATAVPHVACYEQLAARGLTYGPAFRGIEELRTGAGEAVGRVALPSGLPGDGYVAHPAIFDAALQVLIGAAASIDGEADGRLFLPVGIREVVYHGPVGASAWSCAAVTARDGRHLTGDVTIVDDGGAVLVSVRSLRCHIVAAGAGASAGTFDDWLYEDRWEPAPLPDPTSPVVSSVVDAGALALEACARRASSVWNHYYDDVEPALDAMAFGWIARAFGDLGCALDEGAVVRASALEQAVAEPRRPFLARLVECLGTAGVLGPHPDGHVVLRTLPAEDPEQAAAARRRWPDYAAQFDLLERAGRGLGDNLRGARSAQEILFAGDGFPLLEKFYREAPASAFYNTLVARVVSELTRGASPDRPLRILEVGAGTGGTTAAVLPALTGAPETYVFSDVSRGFLDNAATTFAAYPFVTTAVYDVSDGRSSSLSDGLFDVVLAANVVHATPDVGRAIGNLAGLLAPGGALVLLEITRRPVWLDVVFGLTDGWWRQDDRDRRPAHALMTGPQWEALLGEGGLTDVQSIADAQARGEAAQRVIVARAPAAGAAALRERRRFVFLADAGGVAGRVAARLERLGATCALVSPQLDPPAGADAVREALDRARSDAAEVQALVHFGSLDVGEAGTPEALLASQRAGCGRALAVVQALAGRPSPPEVWLVTAGAQDDDAGKPPARPEQATLWGLGRVIMREHPELRCRLVDLDGAGDEASLDALAREIVAGRHEEEVAFRGRTRLVRRLQRMPPAGADTVRATRRPAAGERWQAHIGTPGALQTLRFQPAAAPVPSEGQVAVRVEAASINFRDVMVAMGTIPGLEEETSFGSRQLGLDAAGTIESCGPGATRFRPGDDVMGIVPGAFGSRGVTAEALLTRRPACLDAVQAATVPCVFVTAHYALDVLARLRAGERVLIHSATGGVGLAAIQFAREAGAEIFATAGSAERRDYLRELGVRHVMDSRSLEFVDDVLRATGGEGVDVVLNSLAGDALAAGLRLLRPFGRFLEIGKRDIYQDAPLGLLPFRKNLSLHAIDLDRLCVERPALVGEMLAEVADRFAQGRLEPLPTRAWPIAQLEDAMRFMAQARHVGKVAIAVDESDVVLSVPPAPAPAIAADGTYLVTGGLGGFGLAVAARLVARGAGRLVLVGRRPASPEAAARVDAMRASSGARIDILQADVASAQDVARLLDGIRRDGPPLRGVVHAAMVLDDGPLDRMTWDQFERALAPKIAGAWNLHAQTAGDPLDVFVLFSSIAALLGNPLQGNYAAANAYLDALAHYRRGRNLPALSVSWGVLSDTGYVAGRPELSDYLARQGYLAFTPGQALDLLDHALGRGRAAVMAARLDWSRWAVASPTAATSPRFRRFSEGAAGAGTPRPSGGTAAVDLGDPSTRRARLDEYLRAKLGRVLGASPADLDPERALTEIGLDSLMAVELMTALRLDLGLDLPVVKLLQGVTLNGLAALVLAQETGHEAAAAPAPEAAPREGAVEPASVGPIVPPSDIRIITAPPPPVPAQPPTRLVLASAQPEVPAPAPPEADGRASWSRGQRFLRSGLRGVARLTTTLEVEGLEWVPATGGAVLAVNHLSVMDVPLALAVLPRPAVMLAKDALRASRLLDWLLADVGRAIYVRRGEGDSEALAAALAVLRAGGLVALGPEGHRSPGGLTRGHTGVGYLAAHAGVPVVPMAAWGQERLAASWRRLRRAPVRVRFGPPIVFGPLAPTGRDLRDYSDQVMRAIAAQLPAEYRGVYGDPPAAVGV